MSKLKCEECGFEATNLEPHISKEHDLDLYLSKYDCTVEDLIDPALLAKAKKVKSKTVTTGKTVKIRDAELAIINSSLPTVPEEKYYYFGENCTDIVGDINAKRNVLLTGHTGTGKTSTIEQICARTKNGIRRVNLNGQTSIDHLVGFWTVKGGETVWVDGVLPDAMKKGEWLVLDEIDFAEPRILAVLNPVLEKNGKLFLQEKGNELVTPHENFRVFATANSIGCMSGYRGLYQGTNMMNEAWLDRWQVYHIGYLPEAEEIKVLSNVVPRMTPKVANYLVKCAGMIRESFEKEEIGSTFSLRRMIDWADKMVETKDHVRASESTILNKLPPEESEVVRGIITRVMGQGTKATAKASK
jgi:cobaltochelatase CobS